MEERLRAEEGVAISNNDVEWAMSNGEAVARGGGSVKQRWRFRTKRRSQEDEAVLVTHGNVEWRREWRIDRGKRRSWQSAMRIVDGDAKGRSNREERRQWWSALATRNEEAIARRGGDEEGKVGQERW